MGSSKLILGTEFRYGAPYTWAPFLFPPSRKGDPAGKDVRGIYNAYSLRSFFALLFSVASWSIIFFKSRHNSSSDIDFALLLSVSSDAANSLV